MKVINLHVLMQHVYQTSIFVMVLYRFTLYYFVFLLFHSLNSIKRSMIMTLLLLLISFRIGSVDCPDASDEGWCDVDNDPNAAEICDLSQCKLPECFCSKDGTLIPGRLEANQVPQMIVLTFDDAINFENWDFFTTKLFTPNRKNPNGCPIKATFYVSHQFTNYQMVQKMWNDGHEISVHSIT